MLIIAQVIICPNIIFPFASHLFCSRSTVPVLTPLESVLKPFQNYTRCPGPLSLPHTSTVMCPTSVRSVPVVSRPSQLADTDTADTTYTALPNSTGFSCGPGSIPLSHQECESPVQTPYPRGLLTTFSCTASLNRFIGTSDQRSSKESVGLEVDGSRWNVRILCNPFDLVVHPLLIDLIHHISVSLAVFGRPTTPCQKSQPPISSEAPSTHANLHVIVHPFRIFFCLSKVSIPSFKQLM